MGRRGPPPMPEAMRKLRGRRHRKKEPEAAPTVAVGMPVMPERVKSDAVARALWKRLSAELLDMNVLGPQHGIALAALCVAYSHALDAETQVRKYGLMIIRRGRRPVQNPAVRMASQWWGEVRAWAREFGLTPAAGTRVRAESRAAARQDAAKDSAEAFIFGGKGPVVGHVGHRGQEER